MPNFSSRSTCTAFGKRWGGRWDSNPQQQGSQPWTLPLSYGHHRKLSLACPAGLEPTTPSLEGWCSIRLSYGQLPGKRAKIWSGWRDLNTRHLAPKASALPGCATPRKWRQMILLAHLPGNGSSLRQGGLSGTKAPHFFRAVRNMAVELT